jgi:glycosyltransferase involved in cell wall biosynthesis
VDAPGLDPALGSLPTGLYVAPGDPDELRRALQYLLDHPEVAAEVGRNARRVFEACFTLDAFTERFVGVIRGDATTAALGTPVLAAEA